MKKIALFLFFLGAVQVASAAYDLTEITGTVKKLSACADDADKGKMILWLEDASGNIIVFAAGATTVDSDESQVRKNAYSTALAAYLANESVGVSYASVNPGTFCEVAYDYVLKGISIGTL